MSSTKIKDTTLVNNVSGDYKIPVGNTGNDTTALGISVNQIKTFTVNSLSTVSTTGDYNDLINKPLLPTVNNNTITFTQGGTNKGSFTLNQGSDTTIALDGGGSFTQVQADWNQSDNTQVDYIKNKPTIPSNTQTLIFEDSQGNQTTITFYTTA